MSTGERSERGAVLTLACPRCARKLQVASAHAGKRIRCPHCELVIVVPGGSAGTIPLAGAKSTPPATPSSAARRPVAATQVTADRLMVACPKCAANFLARREHAGWPTKCGKCGAQFTIPRPAPLPAEVHAEESYSLGETVARPLAPLDFPVEPRAIAERIPTDDAPERTFLTGVFNFPFREEARSRLLTLVLLYSILGALLTVVGYFLVGDAMGVVGAGFFALASLWLAVITFGFASACIKAIVEETAAGSEDVSEWPDADWKMWLFAWLPLMYFAFLSVAVGYGVYLLASLWLDVGSWPMDVALFVLFPFLLLSAAECGSIMAPFSGPIAASLFRRPASWLAFYALSALLAVALYGPALVLGWFIHPILGVLYFAPCAAWATFVYARLMGRLGWKISVVEEETIDDEESDGDDEE